MEQRSKAPGRCRATDMLSALLFGLAMLLAAAHGPPGYGGPARSAAAPATTGGMDVADRSTGATFSQRPIFVASTETDKASAIRDGGAGHAAIPADAARIPDVDSRQAVDLPPPVPSVRNAARCYDACGPPTAV